MNSGKYLKVLFVLTVLTLCLPWFTYNAKVMGYCCGYDFLKWLLAPVIFIGICVFYPKRETALILLTEAAQIGNFGILIYTFGFWQEVCNIQSGAQWRDGFRTAQPGFWVSVCFFVLFFVSFQIELAKGKPQSVQRANL